jgi:hypothetical protein
MSQVSFFTPINFGNQPKSSSEWLLEKVDSYFHLKDKKAYVVLNETGLKERSVLIATEQSPCLITALKVASYITLVLPFIMLVLKAILRSAYTFSILNTKEQLQKGLEIPTDAQQIIQSLMPKIQNKEKIEGLIWHSNTNNLIFSLKKFPEYIFKMADSKRDGIDNAEKQIQTRFNNMIRAKEICLLHHLDQLIIPQAQLLKIGNVSLIVEKKLNITASIQEQLYKNFSDEKAIQQLTTFIAKTGFSDVNWGNIPLINSDNSSQPSHIALIDLEEMGYAKGAEIGIFGHSRSRGLIRCLSSQKQINAVIAEAKRHGITRSTNISINN